MTEYTRRQEMLEKKWSRPRPRPSQRNGRAPQGTYTRREKIRVLKRQRFLTIPPRAAERLEYKCGPSPTVTTPYQFKAIAGEHEYMTWPRVAWLSHRHEGRSFVFKNWYLTPRYSHIQ